MSSTDTDDRRHFHRILFDAPVTVTFSGSEFEAKMTDISLNGALLETEARFPAVIGDKIDLNIQLDDATFIDMEALIAHKKNKHIGLRCIHIDMESISHLRRLVELNLGDAGLLERELSSLG